MGGVSGSKSKSKSASGSTSVSQGVNQSRDFGTQLDPMQQAYQQAIWRSMGNIDQQQAANLGYRGLQGGFNSLNQSQNTINSLMSPGADPRLGAFTNQISRQFANNILPQIRSNAQQVGALGSSRAGIAEGVAAAQAGQQIQDFGAQVYGDQQQRRLAAAQLGGQQAQTFGQLGQFGMSIPWFNLLQQQGLIGSPIQTDRGASAFGYNRSESSSSSTGKGSSFETSARIGG